MRHGVLWILILLGLPQVVAADGTIGADASIVPGGELARDGAAISSANSPSGLDLWIDPAQLPGWQEPLHGAPAIESDWPDSDTELDAADRGLSFGLELQPRSRIGALARQGDAEEDPSFGAQLERILEQPVLGLRGRYRF